MNIPNYMLSKNQLAEKYVEIFKPLEVFVSAYYKQYPEIHDKDILKIYESLLKYIKAKLTNFPLPEHKLQGISKMLYEKQYQYLVEIQELYSLEEIQQCLKQLEKSVKLWNREHGSRGYLNFISHFI
jgi:hypothetical protein